MVTIRRRRWRSISLDGRLIVLLAREPRIGVLEASRRLGVARGTVQARLDRLQSNGVIRGFGPTSIRPRSATRSPPSPPWRSNRARGRTCGPTWRPCPRSWSCTRPPGSGDMLCRLVARSNADLQRVIDRVVGFDGIVRASTAIVMENPVPLRIIPLVEQAGQDSVPGGGRPRRSGGRPRRRVADRGRQG